MMRANSDYTYKAAHNQEVVLLGSKSFTNLLVSIQGYTGYLINTAGVLEKKVASLTTKSRGEGPKAEGGRRKSWRKVRAT
jgi:hypothetical protein